MNDQAVCSCLPDYIGTPPTCRPECTTNSECLFDKACVNRKCVDPCPGTCGSNAECRVISHSPVCSCKSGFTGNAFTRCYPIPSSKIYICLLSKVGHINLTLKSFSSTTNTSKGHFTKSLFAISLWSVCPMPWRRRFCFLYLFANLYRITTKLQTRMF